MPVGPTATLEGDKGWRKPRALPSFPARHLSATFAPITAIDVGARRQEAAATQRLAITGRPALALSINEKHEDWHFLTSHTRPRKTLPRATGYLAPGAPPRWAYRLGIRLAQVTVNPSHASCRVGVRSLFARNPTRTKGRSAE